MTLSPVVSGSELVSGQIGPRSSSAVSSVHPQSENAEVHLKSVIQSVSLPAAASSRHQAKKTLNTIFDPSSKLLMNFLLVLMSNKKCIKYVSFVCLLSQEGAILISPTQHPPQVMIVCEADL